MTFSNSFAQVEITLEQLVGTKWRKITTTDEQWTEEYRDGYISACIYHPNPKPLSGGRTIYPEYEYYLTDEVPTTFDKENGSRKKGMYLVERSHKNKLPYRRMWYYTIISFSDKEMVLFEKAPKLKKGEVAIGVPNDNLPDVTQIWERIEE